MFEQLLQPVIRPETTTDAVAIRKMIMAAFGQEAEADLVEALRQQRAAVIALVAEINSQIAGYVLYSPVTIETNRLNRNILGLAPLAVLPALQHRGIGSVLIRASFEICLNQAVDGAVVLGSHDYYPRFGFSPAGNYGMECEYPVPPQDFMVISFHPGGVEGCSGMVHYHPLFAGLGV